MQQSVSHFSEDDMKYRKDLETGDLGPESQSVHTANYLIDRFLEIFKNPSS
jgi:hypothetical protein